ncbi:surface carbohydrate biosynthesis protein [Bacillota bacterium Lsc_1132]
MLDFLILYEHKARELENDCLLKYELERRGYSVEILNIHNLKRARYLFRLKPRVILTSALYDSEDFHYHVNTIVGETNKIVNLQWEQVLSKKWLNVGFHNPKGKAAYATHICWGQETYERLIKSGVKNPVITGPIQTDFLQEKFADYYLGDTEIKKMYNIKTEKVMLYISSFTLANESDEFLSVMSERIDSNVNDIKEVMAFSKRETLKWFNNILGERENITFIYRPHPGELIDKSLQELESKYENFKIIDEFSVKQWIVIADKVFTWISTAIVETILANKSCGILRPVHINDDIETLIYKGANMITTYEDFKVDVDNELSKPPIEREVILKYYDFKENEYAYERMCDLLEKVIKTDEFNIPNEVAKYRIQFKSIIRPFLKRVVIKIGIGNKNPSILGKRMKKKVKLFWDMRKKYDLDIASQEEIDSIINKIDKCIGNRRG